MNNLKQSIVKLKEENKRKEKEFKQEPFQVELLLSSQPNIIRLTYKNIYSQILTAIEELDLEGKLITYTTIKGRKFEGNVPQLVLELVPIFRIKPLQWKNNPAIYLDSYYKKH